MAGDFTILDFAVSCPERLYRLVVTNSIYCNRTVLALIQDVD